MLDNNDAKGKLLTEDSNESYNTQKIPLLNPRQWFRREYPSWAPTTGYVLLWSIASASESGYGALVFNTSRSAKDSMVQAIKVLSGNKINLETLDDAMAIINIASSIANSILTPMMILNIKKHIHDAKSTWQNGRANCLTDRKEKIIFYTNLALFTFASTSASLPISAALIDTLGTSPGIIILSMGGFVGQMFLFWLIGSSFVFDVPKKLKQLPSSYQSLIKNLFNKSPKSIAFDLRTLMANSTRFIRMYGNAAYSLRYIIPNFYSKLSIPYGILTGIAHMHDCIFTQTIVDYEVTFGRHIVSQADSYHDMSNFDKLFMFSFKALFMLFLMATFTGRLFSATGLVTTLLVGQEEEYSIGDSLACLAVFFFQMFGAYQQVIFVKNHFTDPLSITMAKKITSLGIFKRTNITDILMEDEETDESENICVIHR